MEVNQKPLVRLSRSSVDEADVEAVSAALRKAFLGMGADVEAFEKELAQYVGGNRHVICVNTGTTALHLAVQACGIGRGDEVLIPSLTFVASFQAVSATGATPIACDVLRENGCLNPADAARRITPRTKAIMPVHYASGRGALDEIYKIANEKKLRVIEDAAHGFGCTQPGGAGILTAKVGATGDVLCFSFDGIKNITSAEGGAVVTGDTTVADKIRDARLLGVEKDTEKRFSGQRSWEFDVKAQGWRGHMSNLNAALGRSQLRRLDSDFGPRRVQLAKRYVQLLAGIPNLRHLNLNYGEIVPHIFPVFIANGKRDTLRDALRAENIESGIHYKPNHLLTLYGGGKISLPIAEELYAQMLTLPLHFELTDAEQDRVVEVVRQCLNR
jgi:dTDP-4-amino-4,6-dideoxygalactose transaminase